MVSKEKRIIKSLKPRAEIVQPIATEMILPNNSGVTRHPEMQKILTELESIYLKLDASNDPITEDLALDKSIIVGEGSTGQEHKFYTWLTSYISITEWFFLGIFHVPEMTSSANVFSMRNGLYIRQVSQDPTISFFNTVGTGSAVIRYVTANDKIEFDGGTRYDYDNNLFITAANKGVFLPTGGAMNFDNGKMNMFHSGGTNFVEINTGDLYFVKTTSNFQIFNITGNGIVINEVGIDSYDTRMETNTVSDAFFLDAGAETMSFNVPVHIEAEILGPKFKITTIGGYAIKLTNKTPRFINRHTVKSL